MARLESGQTGIRKLSLIAKKSYAVSLPIELVRQLGWQKGDNLTVRRTGRQIVISLNGDQT